MSSRDAHPKWWQVYLTLPLLVVLFAVDNRLKLSARGHQIMQVGIVLFVYGLVHIWLKANSSALLKSNYRQGYGNVRVIRIYPSLLPDAKEARQPMFHLSDSEIKGVLDDTFEMDYSAAESFPVDRVAQELQKE